MPRVAPKKQASKKKASNRIKVVKNMPDFSNDPFVLRKRQQALDSIKKYGLPEDIMKKHNLK